MRTPARIAHARVLTDHALDSLTVLAPAEVFSQFLSIPKGGSTVVEFRLGCNWINNGSMTARTDPSPVPGESVAKTANNVFSQSFGIECV